MSAKPMSPQTPKQTYAEIVAQPTGICTRGMAKKMVVHEASISLCADEVPRTGRIYTISSIMTAASAVIASNSSQHKVGAKVDGTPLPKSKVAPPKEAEMHKPCVASVMIIATKTMEEQMQELRDMLKQVLRYNQKKNKKLDELQREVVGLGKNKDEEVNPTIVLNNYEANEISPIEIVKNEGVACNEDQLQLVIANAVKSQLSEDSSSGACYSKPYTRELTACACHQGTNLPNSSNSIAREARSNILFTSSRHAATQELKAICW